MPKKERIQVLTPPFRVSFPQVFVPRGYKDDPDPEKKKYYLTMLWPKDGAIVKGLWTDEKTYLAEWKALEDMCKQAFVDKVGKDAGRLAQSSNFHNPFMDGDSEKPHVDGYPGHFYAKRTTKQKPVTVDQNIDPIMEQDAFYAGCWARAKVTPYAYRRDGGGLGMGLGLGNVQKIADDDPFSFRTDPKDDFEPVGPGEVDEIETDEGDQVQADDAFDF